MLNFLHNFWFIQCIGVLAMIFSVLSWNSSNRRKILELQSINAFLFIIHYALLDAFSGSLMSTIILMRNFVFLKKDESKWANQKYWLYIFIFVSLIGLLFSWRGLVTILPAGAVIIATYGFYQEKPYKIRLYLLAASILWIPYTIVVHSYSGIIINVVSALGILSGMYRLDRKKVDLI